MKEPTVRIDDDGTMVVDWPDQSAATTVIAREVLEEMVVALNELNEWRSGRRRSLTIDGKFLK